MLTDHTDSLVGTMLGKDYRVIEPIGVGGMAVVYLVEHQTLLKRFAAKVLSKALASSMEARARFTQEAHAASQLDHENIVSISDFGVTVDHRPFFVMELLRGQTLDERLSDRPMPIEEVVAVAVPVARALAHAHAEGIVHLDVKPENIFLVQRSQGRWGVKVVDFGIAKTPLNPRLAKPEETCGSPMFMAPEVCRGDDDVDQRADVYSFGIMLYLMMCGRLPFIDASVQRVLQMQLVQLPAPPREVNAELSPELAVVVERALAKNRNDRYPSMEALLYELEAALPPGADRLLIEAQFGTAPEATPFAATMAIGRQDSGRAARPSQPPFVASVLPTAPQPTPVMFDDFPPESPTMITRPRVPHAPRRPLVIGAVALATLISAGAAYEVTSRSTHGATVAQAQHAAGAANEEVNGGAAQAAEHDAERPAAPAVAITAPTPAARAGHPAPAPTVEPIPEPAVEPAADPAPSVAVAGNEPAAPGRATVAPPHAQVRAKPAAVIHHEPLHPTKRVALAPGPGALQPAAEPVGVAPPLPAPEPPVAPTPVTPPPVAPPQVATAPVIAAPAGGSLDATLVIADFNVAGSLSTQVVRRSLERALPSMRSCYRTAARANRATPAVDLKLTFEIDENSRATQVNARGEFGTLAGCAQDVTRQIRTPEAPDVGTTKVSAVIRFQPS